MFHGKECPHCHAMHHIVDRLVEEGEDIERLEVWHDENNANEMRKFSAAIMNACGGDLGVPAFLDKNGDRAICGEVSYDRLKEWINKE
jgi:hypothetical protein